MSQDDLPPFIFWDGEECIDAGYCLFGASVGGEPPEITTFIQHPYLHTVEMLELLLDVAQQFPKSPHVGFAFDYDVNQIIQDLTWKALITLRARGKVSWNGYTIKHIPGKMFTVSHKESGRTVRVDDTFSFFRCRYDKALLKHGIGSAKVLADIAHGKDNREDFWWKDIDSIHNYWELEVSYGCLLLAKLRKLAFQAGYNVNHWYGPGAFAAHSLKKHRVTKLMAPDVDVRNEKLPRTVPIQVRQAALNGYAGGWFERYKMGMLLDISVYSYDINSAYVYAMSLLPSLANGGTWKRYTERDADLSEMARDVRFGIFRVEWQPDSDAYLRSAYGIPMPLFHRNSDGTICRPVLPTTVWLWNPEAANCTTTPYARIREAWVYETGDSIDEYPFSWIEGDYNKRSALKKAGDPTEFALKSALASYYGRLAQRAGWNETQNLPPMFHQIEWAGWITSMCRSMIYRVAFQAARKGGLISVDTDGIISTVPVPGLPTGDRLGEWKEEEYDGIVYLQNGVYWLRDHGDWLPPKLRGIPHSRMDVSRGIEALQNNGVLELHRRTFVGYGAALHGHRDEWRTWKDIPVKVNANYCGSRVHVPELCRECNAGKTLTEALHDLIPVPGKGNVSTDHKVPWIEDPYGRNAREKLKHLLLKNE